MNTKAPFSTNDILKSYASEEEREQMALKIFDFQYWNNGIYQQYCNQIGVTKPSTFLEIPFLPISFFKTHRVSCKENQEIVFTSSGTTGNSTSKHFVYDLDFYCESFRQSFKYFYGEPSEWSIFALLPSYLERSGSSLIYMAEDLIKNSNNETSGFFLADFKELKKLLDQNIKASRKTLLLGVSFALLDFTKEYGLANNSFLTVMETGGMKGRKKEMVRADLHEILCKGFGVSSIHSEYGMTELLSQAYSSAEGKFITPAWMKVLIREQDDPFSYCESGRTGGINIIDFANLYSCSFISTQDLGKKSQDGSFEVLGRFDSSEARGCNLMLS